MNRKRQQLLHAHDSGANSAAAATVDKCKDDVNAHGADNKVEIDAPRHDPGRPAGTTTASCHL